MEVKNWIIPKQKGSIYPTLFYLVQNLILNEFKYENLENTDIFIDDIERALLYSGLCAIFKNGEKIVALPAVIQKLRFNGRPDTVTAYSYAYGNTDTEDKIKFEMVTPNLRVGADCALIMNNSEMISNFALMTPFIERLAKIWTEHGENLKLSRVIALIAGNSEFKKEFEKQLNELYSKGVAVCSVDNIDEYLKTIQTLDLKVEYRQGEYHKDFDDTWQKMLTILGINNVGVEKRERLLVDEIGANNELLDKIIDTKLIYREYGIKQANELFGLNIKIKERDTNVRKAQKQVGTNNPEITGENEK